MAFGSLGVGMVWSGRYSKGAPLGFNLINISPPHKEYKEVYLLSVFRVHTRSSTDSKDFDRNEIIVVSCLILYMILVDGVVDLINSHLPPVIRVFSKCILLD